jgi:dihydroxyacetone kinase
MRRGGNSPVLVRVAQKAIALGGIGGGDHLELLNCGERRVDKSCQDNDEDERDAAVHCEGALLNAVCTLK